MFFRSVKSFQLIDQMNVTTSVAQWLEHWSSKPGVKSSILSFPLHFYKL